MDQELEQLTNQMNTEIKNIREKYKILKQECRKRHKPPKTKNSSTRKTIPKTLKNQVWDTCIGQEKGVGNCYCCSKEIDSKHFECGHIVAVSNGGTNAIQNLKPVCSLCNKSMGSKNMDEFKQDYMSHVINQKQKEQEKINRARVLNLINPGHNQQDNYNIFSGDYFGNNDRNSVFNLHGYQRNSIF